MSVSEEFCFSALKNTDTLGSHGGMVSDVNRYRNIYQVRKIFQYFDLVIL